MAGRKQHPWSIDLNMGKHSSHFGDGLSSKATGDGWQTGVSDKGGKSPSAYAIKPKIAHPTAWKRAQDQAASPRIKVELAPGDGKNRPVRAKGTSKIGPNTTAPAKARSMTAGPNHSFPIGDEKHARLAIPMASRSEHVGNISAAQAASIRSKARAALRRDDDGDHEYR